MPEDWYLRQCSPSQGYCSTIPTPTAWDCTLSWCLKEYSSTIATNGTLVDNPSKEIELQFPFVPSRDQPMRDADPYPDSCLYDAELGYATASYTPLLIAGYVAPDGPANGKCDRYLRDKDNSTAAVWINMQDSEYISQQIGSIYTQTLESYADSNLGNALWSLNDGDFAKTMATAATGMTNAIRQTANATNVHGDVIYSVTLIVVNWLWLIYPAALISLTILFMVATFVFSTERSDIVWKSSTLAVLFHGLQGWNDDEMTARTISEMEEASTSMEAQLLESVLSKREQLIAQKASSS